MNDRSDFFETAYPAESSGLNVHRLRALLNSEHFVADLSASFSDVQNRPSPAVVSQTVPGPQIDAQPLQDLSDALSEITLLESWWDEVHCEARHKDIRTRKTTSRCSHAVVGRGWNVHGRPGERFRVCQGWVDFQSQWAESRCRICGGPQQVCNWFELD